MLFRTSDEQQSAGAVCDGRDKTVSKVMMNLPIKKKGYDESKVNVNFYEIRGSVCSRVPSVHSAEHINYIHEVVPESNIGNIVGRNK